MGLKLRDKWNFLKICIAYSKVNGEGTLLSFSTDKILEPKRINKLQTEILWTATEMLSCVKNACENKVVEIGKVRYLARIQWNIQVYLLEQAYLPSTDHQPHGPTA